jgi:antitoxin ParD1/3/4
MNLNLTREMADFVSGEVASGHYASASELVCEALRSLRRDREVERQELEILRRKLDRGIAQAEGAEFSTRTVTEIAAAVLAEEED